MIEGIVRPRSMLAVGLVLLLAIGSFGFLAQPARAAYAPVWQAGTAMGDVRAQATIVQDENGLVYVIGGFWSMSSTSVNNVSSYDPATGQWTDLAPLLTATRGAAGAVGDDGKVYVFGGGSSSTTITQIYDPTTDSWSYGASMLVATWQARAALGSDGYIYVAGGYNTILGTNIATVQVYDPALDLWWTTRSMPAALNGGALVSYGSSLYYFGGSSVVWSDATDYAFKYDIWWGTWTMVTDMPQAKSGHAAVMGLDRMMYVFGGGSSGSNTGAGHATGYYYSPDNDSWGALPNMITPARQLGGATTADGKILALGGCNQTRVFSKVESLQAVLSTATLSSSSVPAGGWTSVTFETLLAYSTLQSTEVSMYLISNSGVLYETYYKFSSVDASLAVQVNIPDIAPAGSYRLVLRYWDNAAQNGWFDNPTVEFALTVTDPYTVDEQIADLEAQIALLEGMIEALEANAASNNASQAAKLNELSAALADLEEQLAALQDDQSDVKASADSSGMWGMVNLVLLLVVIALLAMLLMMSRKKP